MFYFSFFCCCCRSRIEWVNEWIYVFWLACIARFQPQDKMLSRLCWFFSCHSFFFCFRNSSHIILVSVWAVLREIIFRFMMTQTQNAKGVGTFPANYISRLCVCVWCKNDEWDTEEDRSTCHFGFSYCIRLAASTLMQNVNVVVEQIIITIIYYRQCWGRKNYTEKYSMRMDWNEIYILKKIRNELKIPLANLLKCQLLTSMPPGILSLLL